jgi:murein DD-endopeptidase MepM/ murein hydrolase activator NlpD
MMAKQSAFDRAASTWIRGHRQRVGLMLVAMSTCGLLIASCSTSPGAVSPSTTQADSTTTTLPSTTTTQPDATTTTQPTTTTTSPTGPCAAVDPQRSGGRGSDGSDRVAALFGNSLAVKDGPLNAAWTTVAQGVSAFDVSGDRLAALIGSDLLVKDGALNAKWTTVAQGVSAFDISGDRIAVVIGSQLKVKDGPLNAQWTDVGTGVTNVGIAADRVAALFGTTLSIKEGPLNAVWTTVGQGVSDFRIASASSTDPGAALSLSLPVPRGASVIAGGPHPFNGGTSGVRSSVDIGAPDGGEMNVYAAAAGVAHVYSADGWSNCWVSIDHADGWQTRYYHLKNVDTSIDGQSIAAGRRIGNAAVPGTETCGTGNFRHVHFSVYRNGAEVAIDGTSIGGYTVHQSGAAYCGYWTRDADGAVVVPQTCEARGTLVNNQ